MENLNIASAKKEDKDKIMQLLKDCSLFITDIDSEKLSHFIVAKTDLKIVAVIGVEIYNEIGLLRSLAVIPAFRQKGIGKIMVDRMLSYSLTNNIKMLFLFTENARDFFSKLGFIQISRSDLPPEIQKTTQFTKHCPHNAFSMFKKLNDNYQ